MSCSVDEAADYADTITGYLEETARKGERVPGGAADVIQALLSHADGVQGFWTAFLTNPDLTASAKPPFDPALVATVSRFPELNIGVISNCMALSAVEEDLFEDVTTFPDHCCPPFPRPCAVGTGWKVRCGAEGGECWQDELMQASARASRERACLVLSALSRQPSPRKGEHGASWLLDLVNYQARYPLRAATARARLAHGACDAERAGQVLEEAASTIELRREEKRLAEARVPTCHHLASAAPLQCFEAAPRCSMGLAEVVGHSATAKARVADALAVLQEAAKREAEVLEQKKKSETEQV